MKNILVISPEYWGESFVSKHHYASYLSEENMVFFLEPSSGWSPLNILFRNLKTRKINGNLEVISVANILPKIGRWPKFIQHICFKIQSKQISKLLNINFDLIWSFDPHRYWDLSIWQTVHTIYHSVDFHPNAEYEKDACRSAALVLGIADLINQQLNCAAIFNIGHGADINNFEKADPEKIVLPGKNRIKAGYVGNFHKHVDYSLLSELIKENTDVDFIFIGPTAPNNLASGNMIDRAVYDELKKQDNVFFTGIVKASELMNYLLHFDLNLVLFKDEFKTIHCNPHKLMGYFYAGGITLSSYIDEYRTKPKELIYVVENISEYKNAFSVIKRSLNTYNAPELKIFRRNFAKENSYSKKINMVLEQLSNK